MLADRVNDKKTRRAIWICAPQMTTGVLDEEQSATLLPQMAAGPVGAFDGLANRSMQRSAIASCL